MSFRWVGRENEVDILGGVLLFDHFHVFVSVPLKIAISDLVRRIKGRSDLPAIPTRCRGNCPRCGGAEGGRGS